MAPSASSSRHRRPLTVLPDRRSGPSGHRPRICQASTTVDTNPCKVRAGLSAWEPAPSGALIWPDLQGGLSVSDLERHLVTGLMARQSCVSFRRISAGPKPRSTGQLGCFGRVKHERCPLNWDDGSMLMLPSPSSRGAPVQVRLFHSLAKAHASFDDPNLVSHACGSRRRPWRDRAGLADLAAEHVRPGGECGRQRAPESPPGGRDGRRGGFDR